MYLRTDVTKLCSKDVAIDVGSQRIIGAQGFADANRYQTPNGGGEQGHATLGHGLKMWIRVDTQVVASKNRNVVTVNDASGTLYGYQWRLQGTNATLQYQHRQSGGAGFTNGPAYTFSRDDIGRILVAHLQWDPGTGLLFQYIQAVLNGLPAACAAYAVPDSSVPMSVGALAAAANGADGISVFGVASWHGVLTHAEVRADYARDRERGKIGAVVGAGVTATHTWPFTQDPAAPTAAPATIVDITGGSNLTRQGSPTLVVASDPSWVPHEAPNENAEVWLWVGDSYAMGAATDPANDAAGYPSAGLYMTTLTPTIAPLSEPTGRYTGVGTAASPGGYFCWLRKLATGRDQVLIPAGMGARTSTHWATDAGSEITNAIKMANFALRFPGAQLKGIVVVQGTNDAIQEIPEDWDTNWTTVESALRAGVTGATNVELAYGRLQVTPPPQASSPTQSVKYAAVRTKQAAWAASKRHMFEVPAGPLRIEDNGLHHTSAGYLEMAVRAIAEMAPLVP